MTDIRKSQFLKGTLSDIQTALEEWDKISTDELKDDANEFRKKTKELLIKLAEQLKALDE